MNKTSTNSPRVMIANRPIGIAILSICLLGIGWVVGHRMALKSPTQALRRQIEREFERKFERKYSNDRYSICAHNTVAITSGLIHQIKNQPKDSLEKICDGQLFSNIYLLSNLQTSDRFEDNAESVGYETWMSLQLLDISSLDQFKTGFHSSKVYDSCRDYFAEREDGQEHYSNLLELVKKALNESERYQELDALVRKRMETHRKTGG